ncbi:hypothetical protein IPF36_16930 [Cupriavidus sp. IK-TO18]|nr:hypothetical protein [Cupriavidus sp. IK-TO18]
MLTFSPPWIAAGRRVYSWQHPLTRHVIAFAVFSVAAWFHRYTLLWFDREFPPWAMVECLRALERLVHPDLPAWIEHAATGLWIGWACFILLAAAACSAAAWEAGRGWGWLKRPWLARRTWWVRAAAGLGCAWIAYQATLLSPYSHFEYWIVWPVAAFTFLLGVYSPEGFAYAIRRPDIAVIALGLPVWLKFCFAWEVKQWWTCKSTIPESALQLAISGTGFLATAFYLRSALSPLVLRGEEHASVYLPQQRATVRRRRRRRRILIEKCLRRAGKN